MAEAFAADYRRAEWRRDVEQLQQRAEALVEEHRQAVTAADLSAFVTAWVALTEDWFLLGWSALTPEVLAASAAASLEAGRPMVVSSPAPPKAKRSPEPAPLPVVVTPAPAPTPEAEPPAEPEPTPEPELEPTPEPTPEPPAEQWVKARELAVLLGCSESIIIRDKRDGVFAGHWRRPERGERRGVMFHVERCREARANRVDGRTTRYKRRAAGAPEPIAPVIEEPAIEEPTAPAPAIEEPPAAPAPAIEEPAVEEPMAPAITADRLRSDPQLLEQLAQLLEAVRNEPD